MDEYERHIDINENRMNFVEMGRFVHDLVAGPNVIDVDSRQMLLATDRTSFRKLREMARAGELKVDGSELYHAFPKRYLVVLIYCVQRYLVIALERKINDIFVISRYAIPPGRPEGLTYQMYVIISPIKKHTTEHEAIQKENMEGHTFEYFKYPMVGLGVQHLDARPLGFPLDRPIDEYHFDVPNSHIQDITIFYKDRDEINKPNTIPVRSRRHA